MEETAITLTSLESKVAIVTGAGQGIGRATSLGMAAAGAAVAVCDLNFATAQEVASQIRQLGGSAVPIPVDVTDPSLVEMMVRTTAEHYGGLDVLVNSAALQTPEIRKGDTDVVGLDLETWNRTLAVNLTGPMLCAKFAVPEMRRRGGGSIINLSSGAAELSDFIRCAYGTSKGGLNTLTRYIAAAFGKEGIRCNAIAPGITVTPGVEAVWSAEALDEMVDHHMDRRLGIPEDLAALSVFLASDAASHLTGQVIHVDGGFGSHLPNYADSVRLRGLSSRERRTRLGAERTRP